MRALIDGHDDRVAFTDEGRAVSDHRRVLRGLREGLDGLSPDEHDAVRELIMHMPRAPGEASV
jgi:prephenate dehydrogenase